MDERLSRWRYEKELARLHIELVRLQEWAVRTGAKICVVFEGRDGAGKGGTIKAITERVSPRIFRVIALPAPTERARLNLISHFLANVPYEAVPREKVKRKRSIFDVWQSATVARTIGVHLS